MSQLRLLITSRGETFSYKGTDRAVRIGRSLKCEFNVPKEDLSREHCLLETTDEDGIYFLTDLGSKNGVMVNGKKLAPQERTRVEQGAEIILANLYQLKVNPISVQTKAEILLEKANPEIETKTFKLELEEPKVSTPDQIPSKIRKITSAPATKVRSRPRKESLQMIVGFLAILAFVLYQALGE